MTVKLKPKQCPGAETLVAYLAGSLPPTDAGSVDTHLLDCSDCIGFVQRASARIHLGTEAAMPVPAYARAQVQPVQIVPPTIASSWISALLDRARSFMESLRMPTLVPLAAAGVLMLVVSQSSFFSKDGVRGTDPEQLLRVTVVRAEVLAKPGLHSDILKTLPRGTEVKVLQEDGEWFRVSLADGTTGWVDRQSFD